MLSRRLRAICLFLTLLFPSAWLAWSHRDMLHTGWLHDDSIYLVGGKSIALGLGPKVLSLPGEMSLTKYPPLLPALAALVWMWNPEGNAAWFALLAWLPVVPMLAAAMLLYRRWGLPALALTAMLALNGYLALFSTTVMSEILFTAWLLAAMLAVDYAITREQGRWWIVAGILASLCYLTRTIGIVLLVAFPLSAWLIRRTAWRRSLWASATMLPAVVAWSWWVKVYQSSGADYTTIYYSDYVRDLLWNISRTSWSVFVWRNLHEWVSAAGRLLSTLLQYDGMGTEMLNCVVGVGAVVGAIRLCRSSPRVIPYAVSSLLISIMLIAWCYPPNERLVFPIFPLLVAGLWHEASRLLTMIRTARLTQPRAAAVAGALTAVIAALILFQHVQRWRENIPEFFALQMKIASDNRGCYDRIRSELPSDAAFVASSDTMLWLHTGRRAIRPRYPAALWYAGRIDKMVGSWMDIAVSARDQGLGYVFMNFDQPTDFSPEQVNQLKRKLENDPALEPLFSCGDARVWRVR